MGDELDRIMAAINRSEAIVIAPPPTQAAVSTISPKKVWAFAEGDSSGRTRRCNNADNYVRPQDRDHNTYFGMALVIDVQG